MENELKFLEKISMIEVKMTELAGQQATLRASVIENIQSSLSRLHGNVEKLSEENKQILNCIKTDVSDMRKVMVSREDLVEYRKISECRLNQEILQRTYLSKSESVRILVFIVSGIGVIWGTIVWLFPLLSQVIK